MNDRPHAGPEQAADPFAAALTVAQRRADAEEDVIGAVLARPADLLHVATAEGVDVDHFSQPDLRVVWSAITVAAADSRAAVLSLAWRALQIDGYRPGPILDRLADLHFPSPLHVRRAARELVKAVAREREVRELDARIRDLLTGRAEPTALAARGAA